MYWLLQIKQDYVYIVTVNSSIQPRDCRAVLGVSTGERESPGCRDQATHMWEAHIRRTVIRMGQGEATLCYAPWSGLPYRRSAAFVHDMLESESVSESISASLYWPATASYTGNT